MSLTAAEKQRRYRDRKRDSGEGDRQGMKILNVWLPLLAKVSLTRLARHNQLTVPEQLTRLIFESDKQMTNTLSDVELDKYLLPVPVK
jgi:hypothetical protein